MDRYDNTGYNGQSFRIVGSRIYNENIGGQHIPGEELTGEVLNDALFQRDVKLEEYFGIDIQYEITPTEEEQTMLSKIQKNIMAFEDAYDLILGSMGLITMPLINMNGIMDFREIPEVDFTQEWWNRNAAEELQLDGKNFFATGAITPRYITSAFILAFNQNLFDDYQLDYPYELVQDGAWTIERLAETVKDVHQDLNGDGKQNREDFTGLVYEGGAEYSFFISAGGKAIDMDAEGNLGYSALQEENLNVIGKLIDTMVTPDFYYPSMGTYTANKMFRESRTLYLAFAACDLSMLREMEDNFGLLPVPKLNESQKEYVSHSNIWIATSVCIPKTVAVDALDRIGTLTDAMAALSLYTSYQAQYEVIMQQRYVRDEESIDMLKLAVEANRYDLAYMFGWGGAAGAIGSFITSGGEYVSKLTSIEKSAISAIEKTIAQFADGE